MSIFVRPSDEENSIEYVELGFFDKLLTIVGRVAEHVAYPTGARAAPDLQTLHSFFQPPLSPDSSIGMPDEERIEKFRSYLQTSLDQTTIQLTLPDVGVEKMAFSPDGRFLAVCGFGLLPILGVYSLTICQLDMKSKLSSYFGCRYVHLTCIILSFQPTEIRTSRR